MSQFYFNRPSNCIRVYVTLKRQGQIQRQFASDVVFVAIVTALVSLLLLSWPALLLPLFIRGCPKRELQYNKNE